MFCPKVQLCIFRHIISFNTQSNKEVNVKIAHLICGLYHKMSKNKINSWVGLFLPDCSLSEVKQSQKPQINGAGDGIDLCPFCQSPLFDQNSSHGLELVFSSVLPCSRSTVVMEMHKRPIDPYWSQTIFKCKKLSHILFQWLAYYLLLYLHIGSSCPLTRTLTDSLLDQEYFLHNVYGPPFLCHGIFTMLT